MNQAEADGFLCSLLVRRSLQKSEIIRAEVITAKVLGIECDGSDRVGLVLRVPEGVELKPGDLLCGTLS